MSGQTNKLSSLVLKASTLVLCMHQNVSSVLALCWCISKSHRAINWQKRPVKLYIQTIHSNAGNTFGITKGHHNTAVHLACIVNDRSGWRAIDSHKRAAILFVLDLAQRTNTGPHLVAQPLSVLYDNYTFRVYERWFMKQVKQLVIRHLLIWRADTDEIESCPLWPWSPCILQILLCSLHVHHSQAKRLQCAEYMLDRFAEAIFKSMHGRCTAALTHM